MLDFSGHLSYLASVADPRRVGSVMREGDVRQAIEQVTIAYGFQGFVVITVPAATARSLGESILMTNWPEDFIDNYDAACMMVGSPVIDRLRRSTVPFVYDVSVDPRVDGKGNIASALFNRVGLTRGIYIPVHTAQGVRGAVGFSGERDVVSAKETSELTFIASFLFERLSEAKDTRERMPVGLSKREIECLNWAAAGKTTTEMAKILDLSEYTINHYLNRATRKLDSVNRVQTVAKAIRAGLIN